MLAQAVQDQFPDAKLGIGPPIKDGFYYDFDVAEPFTPEDLPRLEKRMKQIIKGAQRFSRRVVRVVEDRPASSWRTSRSSSNWSTTSPASTTPR